MKKMNAIKLITLSGMLAVGVTCLTAGCARTVSKTQETHVSPTGRVTTTEQTVTENPDGTLNQSKSRKTINP